TAEAAVAAANAAIRARQLDVEFTRVTAPISGRVSDRRVDPGNLIGGG
ncbi:MAG TPA: efflux transporter periplasmic adaptor subunit, partial [Brevundimonas diminuta]|nr:efflux transporter periplasmic adaptor subunit [Brevundimonas diminuta]